MTDKARSAAAGAMNNVRTAIDSAKRIGFNGNTVGFLCLCTICASLVLLICCWLWPIPVVRKAVKTLWLCQ